MTSVLSTNVENCRLIHQPRNTQGDILRAEVEPLFGIVGSEADDQQVNGAVRFQYGP